MFVLVSASGGKDQQFENSPGKKITISDNTRFFFTFFDLIFPTSD